MDGTRRAAATTLSLALRPRTLGVLAVALLTFGLLASSAFGAKPSVEGSDFTIEKLQLIAGSDADFTAEELTGEVGEIVEYEIVVTNTGDSTLNFSPLSDPSCTGLSPAGATELEPQESETFTCEELLTEPGEWSNVAEIKAGEQAEASNEVVVEVPEEPSFTVEKLQAIDGSGFTTDELVGKVGQTVEYEIVVANTGNTTLSFSSLEDANCTNISPAGETELAPGTSETFSCEHTLTTSGQVWSNEVTIESEQLSEDSNEVFVRTLEEPEFTIEKLQAIPSSGADFTKGELTGALGMTVDYEIVVSNTGSAPLGFSALEDANCTNISPAGATELAPGASETFSCEHVLSAAGPWANVAAIEATLKPREEQPTLKPALRAHAVAPVGSMKKASSNQVVVNVPAEAKPATEQKTSTSVISTVPAQLVKAQCTVSEAPIKLYGASGSKRSPFAARIPSLGITQVTFYLDGRKLKTLTAAQAKNGKFAITIDPTRLAYGAHKVSIKTVMAESACAAIARSAVFVHPRPTVAKPKFTG